MKPEFLAAIDCGTNSFHLIIVRLKEDGGFEIIDREREVIRLGLGNKIDLKIIAQDAIDRAVSALKRFNIIARSYNASVRAVATSAIREAENKDVLINRVYDETGIEIEVISGFEEARLIYTGVLKSLNVYDKKILCIDIGGGSTEFIVGHRGEMLYANSVKLGAVRLSQKFFPEYRLTEQSLNKCSEWIYGEIFPVIRELRKHDYEMCIGTSGTIMSSALMIQAGRKGSTSSISILNNFAFSFDEFENKLFRVIKKSTVDERKKIPGLDEGRADIIPAGMLILYNILHQLKIEELTVSGYSLREGIITDTISRIIRKEDDRAPDIRKESIFRIAGKFNYDREHSLHVARLALKLFDDLKELHKLPEAAKDYLEAAAILHDTGYYVSHTGHHKHSYYLIRNGELLGFNETEIEIIANTARYHRKSHPKTRHSEFHLLHEEDKNIIKRLSALLRIADALDRTHRCTVKGVKAIENEKTVELVLEYDELPEIEIWNLGRRKELFEEVFDKQLVILTGKPV